MRSPLRCYTVAVLLLGLGLASGCSARQHYEFNRSQGEQNAGCDERRTVQAERDCRAAYRMSYDEYQRARAALQEEVP